MLPKFDPYNDGEILNTFAKELDSLIKTPKDVEKTIQIMEKLLEGSIIESTEILGGEESLIDRVNVLWGMINQPKMDRINTFVIGTLKGKMEEMVADKVGQLRGLQACKELCQKMLPSLSMDRIQSLITAVEGFFLKGLSENSPPEKALASALAKGILSSFLEDSDIHENTALRRALELDETLKDYLCGISQDLVGSDAVFLSREGTTNSSQRYHRAEITNWLTTHNTDPMTRAERTENDIVVDPQAEEVIKNASRAWIDSKMRDVPSSLQVRVLTNKGLLLALAAAYPLIKKSYETDLERSYDPENALEKVGTFTEEVMSRFAPLAEEISAYVEQVPPRYYPYIKEFIRQAYENVHSGVSLPRVKGLLVGKMAAFTHFFDRIDSTLLSPISKEKAVAIIGEAISKETPLDLLKALFLDYIDLATNPGKLEEIVRNTYPGLVMGGKEWAPLGPVGEIPCLPEDILEKLNEPSPSDPTKTAGQTGILLLVPEFVAGQPLTLNRMGELIKERYFPSTAAGYRYMSSFVEAEYGEIPAGKSEWVLIEKDILPDSRNKSFDEQEAMIKPPYEVPELLPMTAGIFLKYLNSDPEERLFKDHPLTYTRCKETISGFHVVVGGFSAHGLGVDTGKYDTGSISRGVGAQRKFGP